MILPNICPLEVNVSSRRANLVDEESIFWCWRGQRSSTKVTVAVIKLVESWKTRTSFHQAAYLHPTAKKLRPHLNHRLVMKKINVPRVLYERGHFPSIGKDSSQVLSPGMLRVKRYVLCVYTSIGVGRYILYVFLCACIFIRLSLIGVLYCAVNDAEI